MVENGDALMAKVLEGSPMLGQVFIPTRVVGTGRFGGLVCVGIEENVAGLGLAIVVKKAEIAAIDVALEAKDFIATAKITNLVFCIV